MSKCKAIPQPNRFSVDSNRGQAAVAVVLLSADALFSLSGYTAMTYLYFIFHGQIPQCQSLMYSSF